MFEKIVILLFFMVGVGVIFSYFQKMDDSDDIKNGIRSGMTVYTDHKTGCQYLSRPGLLSGFIGSNLIFRKGSCDKK